MLFKLCFLDVSILIICQKQQIAKLLQLQERIPVWNFWQSNGTKYSRMDQVNLWKTALKEFEGVWSAWSRPYPFEFLKAVFHKFYLVHSWYLCSKYSSIWQLLRVIILSVAINGWFSSHGKHQKKCMWSRIPLTIYINVMNMR